MQRRIGANAFRPAVLAALAAVIALATTRAFVPARAADAPIPVRIALFPGDVAGETYDADELGFFTRAGLVPHVIELNNGGAIAAAVAGGSADIGMSNVLSLAIAHERGLPFKVLVVGGLSLTGVPTNGILSVAANSPIRSARDLGGKTIAVDVLGGLPALGVKAWVDANGGDSKSVRIIELGFPEMEEAVRSGRIDAALINLSVDPTVGKPGDPLRTLAIVYDAIAPRFAASVWFCTSDWLAQHPEVAQKFVAAITGAARWANAHHHESAQILAKYIKQSPAQIESAPRVVYLPSKDPALLQPLIDLAAKYGSIAAPFPARDLIAP